MAKVTVKIKRDGTTEFEVDGVTGNTCQIITSQIEKALGTKIDSQEKPEFFVELDGVKQEVHEE